MPPHQLSLTTPVPSWTGELGLWQHLQARTANTNAYEMPVRILHTGWWKCLYKIPLRFWEDEVLCWCLYHKRNGRMEERRGRRDRGREEGRKKKEGREERGEGRRERKKQRREAWRTEGKKGRRTLWHLNKRSYGKPKYETLAVVNYVWPLDAPCHPGSRGCFHERWAGLHNSFTEEFPKRRGRAAAAPESSPK